MIDKRGVLRKAILVFLLIAILLLSYVNAVKDEKIKFLEDKDSIYLQITLKENLDDNEIRILKGKEKLMR